MTAIWARAGSDWLPQFNGTESLAHWYSSSQHGCHLNDDDGSICSCLISAQVVFLVELTCDRITPCTSPNHLSEKLTLRLLELLQRRQWRGI